MKQRRLLEFLHLTDDSRDYDLGIIDRDKMGVKRLGDTLFTQKVTVGEKHPPENSPGVMFGELAASVSV